MSDARFEDSEESAVYVTARDGDDVTVISALCQDAVFPFTEMIWKSRQRQFAILFNRFRWEDRDAAEREGRGYERVRSVLSVGDVTKVRSMGLDQNDRDTILSVLSIGFEAGADGTGRLVITLAGDGAVSLNVECLDVTLRDVSQPYLAPSGRVPAHDV